MNLVFGLFWTWILQATQAVKVKFEIEKKSSSSNLIFQTQFFKYQVKSNKFENLVTLLKWAVWSGTLFTLKIDPEFSNMCREIGGLDYLKVPTKNTLTTVRLYIFYSISKDHFFVYKEVFSENSVLMYGLYSRAAYDGARTVVVVISRLC